VDQYDLIMKGVGANNENIVRDHVVFNIGLRDLSSASIVFSKDKHLYKYIAEDSHLDQWTYKREDGWCVPEQDGAWNMILNDDISLAQPVNNKFLFDLTYDVSERTNLLQLSEHDAENSEIVKDATTILESYTQHSLYSEHLSFLWNRLAAGDPQLKGEGSFVSPFLSESQYFKHLAKGFGRIENKFVNASKQAMIDGVEFDKEMPFSKKLKALYFHKWEAPEYAAFESIHAKNWYIYTIIGIVIVALIVIIIVSIARWRHLRTTAFYKNGYEPIKDPKPKQVAKQVEEETKEEEEKEGSDAEDRAEYTHIDSMQSMDSNRSNKSNGTLHSQRTDSTLEIVD